MTQPAYNRRGWRRQHISVCGRFGPDDSYLCLASDGPVSTYGFLAAHPARHEIVKPRKDPESWRVRFIPKPSDQTTWVVTHVSTGLRLSRGSDNRGYRKKGAARDLAKLVGDRFASMLEAVPTTRGTRHAVRFLQTHSDWDDLVEIVRDFEEKYTHEQPRNPRERDAWAPIASSEE